MKLSDVMSKLLAPLFEVLPLADAMRELVVMRRAEAQALEAVKALVREPVIAARPALVAGLWLYVDDLHRSHEVSQAIDDATGSFWHAIMHRREGDFGNSHYWFRRAGKHPAMKAMAGYDAHGFIDAVEQAHRGAPGGEAPAALIEMQRREWAALFQWCVGQ